jgi:DNA repair protein RecO (recombination protein O)
VDFSESQLEWPRQDMEQTIKGLIIHHIRYADSSFIVRIFCDVHGMKSFMVRSGKSAKSSKLNILQPLNLVEFESAIRENAQIQSPKNIRISSPYHHIPFDQTKMAMVMFLNEILYKTIPDDYVNDQLYRFLSQAMVLLDDAIDARNFHLWCLIEISRQYGFFPQYDEGIPCNYFDLSQGEYVAHRPLHPHYLEGECAATLLQMLDMEWPQAQALNMKSQVRRQLLESLVHYIRLHLENLREIKSLSILYEVFH